MPRCENCTNWHDLIHILQKNNCSTKAHFSFKNVFFNPSKNTFITNQKLFHNISVLVLDSAMQPSSKYPGRSKFIMNPRGVMVESIHKLYQSWPPRSNVSDAVCMVEPAIGALHHYRRAKPSMMRLLDLSAHRFKDDIINRVLEARNKTSQL